MASILKELEHIRRQLSTGTPEPANGNRESSFLLSQKNAEHIAYGLSQQIFRAADWDGVLQALFRPQAERLYLAGAVEELMRYEALLPGAAKLRELDLYPRAASPATKDSEALQRLRELGLVLPAEVLVSLPPWLRDRMAAAVAELMSLDYWAEVGTQVQADVARVLAVGLAEGKSIGAIAKALQEAVPEYTRKRAILVARTETGAILNAGQLAVMEEMQLRTDGILDQKEWMATLDNRCRPEHAEAHGQIRKIRDKFIVGGEECDYPGDPALSIRMRVNCRCTVISGGVLSAVEQEG